MAQKTTSKDPTVIAEFAESLLLIPKTLALNANLDAIELVGKLQALHHHF